MIVSIEEKIFHILELLLRLSLKMWWIDAIDIYFFRAYGVVRDFKKTTQR